MIIDFIEGKYFNLDKLLDTYSNNIAIAAPSGNIRYRDIKNILVNASAALKNSGIKKGQKIALYKENSAAHLILMLLSWIMDFIYVPLNFKTPIGETLEKMDHDFIFCDAIINNSDNKILKTDIIFEEDPDTGRKSHLKRIDTGRETTIVYTSGSTGTPKGVVHTVGNYIYSSIGTIEHLKMNSTDRWIQSLPLYHAGGILIFIRTLLCGGTTVLPMDMKDITPEILDNRSTIISLVPTQLIRLIENGMIVESLRSFKAILLGGAPAPKWLIERSIALELPVIITYGSTESCAQVTALKLLENRNIIHTVGKPLKYREINIDANRIIIGGPTLFKYYLIDKKKIFPFEKNGMFITSDSGRLDSQGNLILCGRRDNVFISGGENINPHEIEGALLAIEKISTAIVMPVEHKEFGMVPWAFIETCGMVNKDSVKAELKKKLPSYKIPKRIVILNEMADRNNMKYSRAQIEKIAARMLK